MTRFVFQFDSLLRYRRYRRGLVRQLLAEILADLATEDARRADAVTRRERTLDELRSIGAGGTMDVGGAASRRFHSGVLLAEVRDADHRREIVIRQRDLCREALVESDRDVRALERLRDRRLDEFRRESDRREQHVIEETWAAVRLGLQATPVGMEGRR